MTQSAMPPAFAAAATHPAHPEPAAPATFDAIAAADAFDAEATAAAAPDPVPMPAPPPMTQPAEPPEYAAALLASSDEAPALPDATFDAEATAAAAPDPVPMPAPPPMTQPAEPPAPSLSPARRDSSATSNRSGRHADVDSAAHAELLPDAPGLRVLIVGGGEPLGGMVAERLLLAGHQLAVHDVTLPSDINRGGEPPRFRITEPISLSGDRSDAEEMVHTVARAEVALGGMDAIVVLPAGRSSTTGLDADAATWADAWSHALTTEILAAACATHIAARSFMARRKAGRIILVTNGHDGARAGAMPTSSTRAALSRLGADLSRELSPHGIGVSVVTTGPSGAEDFAITQVADVVEALLSTPILSGMSSRIG